MLRLSAALSRAQLRASATHLLLIGNAAQHTTDIARHWPAGAPHLRLVTLNAVGVPHCPPPFHGQSVPLRDNVSWVDWGNLPSSGHLSGIGRFHGVWINQPEWIQSDALAQALRRHVWRDSWLIVESDEGKPCREILRRDRLVWEAHGWIVSVSSNSEVEVDALHCPRWPTPSAPSLTPSSAVVVGAGLAGASAVYHLTQRGWQIEWLDAHPDWARGASALPVGLLSPHPTASPTPMSELSQIGLRCTRKHLDRLLPNGPGWQRTPVVRVDDEGQPSHPEEAWMIEPKALVDAWGKAAMRSGRVAFRGQTRVAQLQRVNDKWMALDVSGAVLAQAEIVVVANAWGAQALVGETMQSLRGVAGQMSWASLGADDAPLAPEVRRSHGVVSPGFQSSQGRIWAVGSTYRRGVTAPLATESDHDANRDCLARLCPEGLNRFDAQRANGELNAYVGVRCASPDRMPLIGAIPAIDLPRPRRGGLEAMPRQPGLYAFTALGSRGLTLAAWGGETLADLVQAMPLATERSWIQACDPARTGLHSKAL